MTEASILRYPRGDLRRMLAVLSAICEQKSGATLVGIARRTGLDKRSVTHLVAQAREQAGVKIAKHGPTYVVVDLGPYLRRKGVVSVLMQPDQERRTHE